MRITGEYSHAPSGASRIVVDYQPIGVCLLITPWNFPAAMATRKIAPALAAGCKVILKPASETPLIAYALAKMRNAGEACTAANRFYVQSVVDDAFVEGLARRMAGLRVGSGIEADTECGPMITAQAVGKIDRLVKDAVARAARALCGGAAPEGAGYFYPPTVLADVPPDAAKAHEVIFGPVAPVSRFVSEREAVEKANETEYGLAAYIYTRDLARAFRVAKDIESGMIGLNRGLMSDPAAPFGGVKQSGIGREGGQ